MSVSDFLGEGYFYTDLGEAAHQLQGEYYIVHSRRIGEPLDTGITYSPSKERTILADPVCELEEDGSPSIDSGRELDDVFEDYVMIDFDGIECVGSPWRARRDYPEEVYCTLLPWDQDYKAPLIEGRGLANALYRLVGEAHVISFGYKVNEDKVSGYQFVQMEIQRMNPMERYLVLGVMKPEDLPTGSYENNLSAILNQPLHALNTGLKSTVFRKFARETYWREEESSPHDNLIDYESSSYKVGIFESRPYHTERFYEFDPDIAEGFQDIWGGQEDGRLEQLGALVRHLANRIERLVDQTDAHIQAWEHHCRRFKEMAREMLMGELAGGEMGDRGRGLIDVLQRRKEHDLEMKKAVFKFAEMWLRRSWSVNEIVADVTESAQSDTSSTS